MTQGDLTDDRAYLKDLTEKCNTKSKQWDQRSQGRASELTALTSALTIIKDKVAGKISDKTVRFVETTAKEDKAGPISAELQMEDEDIPTDAYDEVLQAADAEVDDE